MKHSVINKSEMLMIVLMGLLLTNLKIIIKARHVKLYSQMMKSGLILNIMIIELNQDNNHRTDGQVVILRNSSGKMQLRLKSNLRNKLGMNLMNSLILKLTSRVLVEMILKVLIYDRKLILTLRKLLMEPRLILILTKGSFVILVEVPELLKIASLRNVLNVVAEVVILATMVLKNDVQSVMVLDAFLKQGVVIVKVLECSVKF